ncbi:ankyrin repeat-containing protein DDB_G0279043-like [Haliotis rubra]|uniref:ankyrin repeat-containing protein DDB_G0279043-like n=1 Tax=Haliotis rubra TaxID=36100 RepID=UPI001EE5602A|nr:ankyrin repeat-containing protein DDB_G0279043-like [Haliotis rubra]
MSAIGAKEWSECCKHVKTIEDGYWPREIAVEKEIDRIVIEVGLASDSDTETDSETTERAPQDRSRENNKVQKLVEEGDYAGLEKLLDSEKVDLDVIGVDGQTPAMYAAKTGRLHMFKLLARHGADMTVIDKSGSNILHLAVKGEMIQVVEYVLNHRNTLDVNRKDDDGQTPLMVATSAGYDRIAEFIRRKS